MAAVAPVRGEMAEDQGRPNDPAPVVHPSAVVHPDAKLGLGVRIGAFCRVGPDVELGNGSELISHVTISGRSTIGPRSRLFPFASVGDGSCDQRGAVTIGSDCIIREGVAVLPGEERGSATIVADRCFLMAHSSVGRGCALGRNVTVINNAMLGAGCRIGEYAIISGAVEVHPSVRIGAHAFIAAGSSVDQDVIPYGMAFGDPAYLRGVNVVGLRRRNFTRQQIHDVRYAYRLLFAEGGPVTEWVEEVAREFPPASIVHHMLAFIGSVGRNPILTPARRFFSQRYVSDPEGPREPDSVVVWARQIG